VQEIAYAMSNAIAVLVAFVGLGGWAYRLAGSEIVLPTVNRPEHKLPSGFVLVSPEPPTPVKGLTPVGVCLLVSGDDGLTQHFVLELNKVIDATPPLYTSGRQAPLIVTVPAHLEWLDVDGRQLATYTIAVEWTGKEVAGVYRGSCWADELSHCANAAAREVQRVALAAR
jgi:hypothetical protein